MFKTVKTTTQDLANVEQACIWKGCTKEFHSEMPEGWTWQINYDRKPTILRATPKQWVKQPHQDFRLCPEQTKLLNTFYKPNSGVFSKAMSLSMRPERDILDEVLQSLPVRGNA